MLPRYRRGRSAALRCAAGNQTIGGLRVRGGGRGRGEVAPKKGKPTAVIQTEDIKSIAIELERFIITRPKEKDYCDKKIH